MFRSVCCGLAVWLWIGASLSVAGGTYSIKKAPSAIPKELKESFAKLLSEEAVQLYDAKRTLMAEWWFCKKLPAKATANQIKNGLTYRELDESTVLGAVRFPQPTTDYRKQKIKAGVFTIRLGFQPMDGDHMGTAPYSEFGLLAPAALDEKPDTMAPKELQELSNKAATGSHPAVFLLVPTNKPPAEPQLANKGKGTWVLSLKEDVEVNGQKASLGIGLTVIGHAE
jgi:hypothetical protein